MKTLKFYCLCLLSVLCSTNVWAYDFEVDGIYYNVSSSEKLEAEVTYGDWNPEWPHDGKGYIGDIVLPATVKYRNMDFKVTAIGHRAFQGCNALSSIDLKNVTTIGENAFEECVGLTSIDLKNVNTIGWYAFLNCKGLTSVDFSNVETIKGKAFYKCSSLTSIVLKNVTSIGSEAFGACKSLTSVDMQQKTTIGELTFSFCSALSSIDFKNVTSIGSSAFWSCTSLTSVDLKNVTSIRMNAFEDCSGLISVDFGAVTQIPSYGFSNCSNLKQIHLRNVNSIGECAFEDCDKIELIKTLEKNPPTIGYKNSFSKLGYLATVHVPAGCKSIYQNTQYWKDFYDIIEDGATDQLSLTLQCNEGGRVDFASTNVSNGSTSVSFNKGEKVEMTFVAEEGYELQSVVVNGNDVTANVVDGHYTVTMDEKTDVVVTFGKASIKLTIKYADCGELLQDIVPGNTYTFTIRAAQGWKINTVTFNGVDVTSELDANHKYTTPTITADAVLNVSFETETPAGVADLDANRVSVRGFNGSIVVDGADRGEEIKVYTIDGALVAAEIANGATLQFNVANDKVYLIKVGQRTFKLSL